MNILFILILTVLIVAVMSFLMPWVSKTIEEPFQGSSSSCPPQSLTEQVFQKPSKDGPMSWADYVELGKQKYNFLNFLQGDSDRRAFDASPTPLGSIDTTPIPGAPAESNTMLKRLNTNIRNALETVDIVPRSFKHLVAPNITLDGNVPVFKNQSDYMADATTNGDPTAEIMSYVEERLPPQDGRLEDAAKCEMNNMLYFVNVDGTRATRDFPLKRADMCAALAPSDVPNSIKNAFNTTDKLCGVCLKEAKPINTMETIHPKDGYNGIGAMFMSLADKNRDEAAGRAYKPSYGACAEGYFFVPGEQEKCMNAAKRLNCEEIQKTGGFNGGKAMDGVGVSESNCFACVTGSAVNYLYYSPAQLISVRVRVVVPIGTGRTILKVNVERPPTTPGGQSTTEFVGTYILRSKSRTEPQLSGTNIQFGDTTRLINNAAYFVVPNVPPGAKLHILAAQEFPHRPTRTGRAAEEVFFVGFPTNSSDLDASATELEKARILAASLDCQIATEDQLNAAQQEGMNICNVGIAADGKKYIVRSRTISENNFVVSTTDGIPQCTLLPSKGGFLEVAQDAATGVATGVWCYGIKPASQHLDSAENGALFERPNIPNFYTYFAQENTSVINETMRKSLYSTKYADQQPNFRGICIQLEHNNTASVSKYEAINVGIEDHIVAIGETDISNMRSNVDRLKQYSRNGRFNDSERISFPKPGEEVPMAQMNQTQYWLWSPLQRSNPTEQSDERTFQSPVFKVSVEIPGYFYPSTYPEDQKKCNSVLYPNQKYLDRTMKTACDEGIKVEDASDGSCLAYLFKAVGGDLERGLLSPTHPTNGLANRKRLATKETGPRSQQEVVEFLRTQYVEVAKGEAPPLRLMNAEDKQAAMNRASQDLFGRDAVGPCQKLVMNSTTGIYDAVDKTVDEIDATCLDHLYRNTTVAPTTYSNMAPSGAFSGLKYPEEYTVSNAEEQQAFPYKACQPTGSWAPLTAQNGVNEDAVREIKAAMASAKYDTATSAVAKARAVLDNVYQTANGFVAGASPEEKERALKRCYGISKKTFETNCIGVRTRILYFYRVTEGASPEYLKPAEWEFTLIDNENEKRLLTGGSSEKAVFELAKVTDVSGVQIKPKTESLSRTPILVVLRDGTKDDGVAAQKLLRTGDTLSFLQEDIRPYLIYDASQINAGVAYRFESAVGRRYFLQSTGAISQLPENPTTDSDRMKVKNTNFVLGKRRTTAIADDVPVNTMMPLTDTSTLFVRGQDGRVTSKKVDTEHIADWSIVPALNGAYAFVSIAWTAVPGMYLVAKRKATATEEEYEAVVERVDPTNDVQAFHACWRLMPVLS